MTVWKARQRTSLRFLVRKLGKELQQRIIEEQNGVPFRLTPFCGSIAATISVFFAFGLLSRRALARHIDFRGTRKISKLPRRLPRQLYRTALRAVYRQGASAPALRGVLRFYSRFFFHPLCFLSVFTPRGDYRRAAHHFAEGKASSTASGRHHGAAPRIIAHLRASLRPHIFCVCPKTLAFSVDSCFRSGYNRR